MFRLDTVARVGFVKLIDRSCSSCGNLGSSKDDNTCTKCHAKWKPMLITTDDGDRPYCWTEVVFYPILTPTARTKYEKYLARINSIDTRYVVKLYGHYSKEQKVLIPAKVANYLPVGRWVRLSLNTKPELSLPFTSKDGQLTISNVYTLDRSEGDQIELLSEKGVDKVNDDHGIFNNKKEPAPDPRILELETMQNTINNINNTIIKLKKDPKSDEVGVAELEHKLSTIKLSMLKLSKKVKNDTAPIPTKQIIESKDNMISMSGMGDIDLSALELNTDPFDNFDNYNY